LELSLSDETQILGAATTLDKVEITVQEKRVEKFGSDEFQNRHGYFVHASYGG